VKISRLCSALITSSLWIQMASSSAQTSAQPPSTDKLAGTSWQLVRFQSSDDMTLTPEAKDGYTLEFADGGHLTAQVDCNRGMGTWTSSRTGQLRLGPLALTRAMCPPTALNKRLPKDYDYVRSYVLKNGHLFLSLQADGGIYEFEPMNATSSVTPQTGTPLENTNWKLTQLGTTSVTADPHRGPNLTLNSEQHRVSGSGGCNRIMGGYTLEGEKLKLTQMASSMMACASAMDTERAFLDALGEVDSWKITGDKLELLDAGGNAVATFEAAPKKERSVSGAVSLQAKHSAVR